MNNNVCYLQAVFRQSHCAFLDDFLNPLHGEVRSGLLQTLAEEPNNLWAQ